jgi:hypothetical protein
MVSITIRGNEENDFFETIPAVIGWPKGESQNQTAWER